MKESGPDFDKTWLGIPYRESYSLHLGQGSQARAVRIADGGCHTVTIAVNGESNDKPCDDSPDIISIREATLRMCGMGLGVDRGAVSRTRWKALAIRGLKIGRGCPGDRQSNWAAAAHSSTAS